MVSVDFSKYPDGLVPVIIQDSRSRQVLMLGYMNAEALEKTRAEMRVTFYSRSRQRLWTKGETSGNFLVVQEIQADCDRDSLLIRAIPAGPVCHTGKDTCFNETNNGFSLSYLQSVMAERKSQPADQSYTARLFERGLSRMAQKLGEEAVELVIESLGADEERFLNEAADLLYHFLVLLEAKGKRLEEVEQVLAARHARK